MLNQPNLHSLAIANQTLLIINSFQHFLKRDLISLRKDLKSFADKKNSISAPHMLSLELVEQLFFSPFVLLSHTPHSDPDFNYANAKALELFEYDWDAIIKIPSRYSAEKSDREARENLLAAVDKRGFIDNYSGIRISSTGKRFKINNAIIWNLIDEKNNYRGQAAYFDDWEFLP